MAANLDRAILLLNQSRFDLAEKELRASLAEDPADAVAHAFLALCLAGRGEWQEAGREAGAAVGLAPDLPFAHYVAAKVLLHQDRYDEAEAAAREAIRLDPADASAHALLAATHFERRRWADALEAAERGLTVNPDHSDCVNLRAMALVKLGRRREAGAAIDGALARDPENALTHANQGWTLLHGGDHRRALEHFREALRLDPELEWARAGIVEALKARHLVYRLMLRFFLWMSRLSGQAQWVVILALFFGPGLLRDTARAYPGLAPVLGPLAVAVVAFVVMTWIADPLFNLLLRLNRFGRLALAREQVVASNWLGVCVLGLIAAVLAWLATGSPTAKNAAFVAGLLMLPVSATFRVPTGRPRAAMAALTIATAAAGLATLALPYSPLFDVLWALGYRAPEQFRSLASRLVQAFMLGAVGSTWLSAALARSR